MDGLVVEGPGDGDLHHQVVHQPLTSPARLHTQPLLLNGPNTQNVMFIFNHPTIKPYKYSFYVYVLQDFGVNHELVCQLFDELNNFFDI